MNVPNLPTLPVTPPAASEVVEVVQVVLVSNVTERSARTPPCKWNVTAYEDGVQATHDGTGELFVGSVADFNKHLFD